MHIHNNEVVQVLCLKKIVLCLVHAYEDMNLFHKPLRTFTAVPIVSTQKTAPSPTRNEMKRNPFWPPLLSPAFVASAVAAFPALVCPAPKLDMRCSARLIRAFSEANAGLLGTESNKAEMVELNQDSEPPPSWFPCL